MSHIKVLARYGGEGILSRIGLLGVSSRRDWFMGRDTECPLPPQTLEHL
jgi:hypothetical protein